MTPDELRALLAELGWTLDFTADVFGVHSQTVSGWLTGSHPIPKYVGGLLSAGALKALSDKLRSGVYEHEFLLK